MTLITRVEAVTKKAMTEEDSIQLVLNSPWNVKAVKFFRGHDGDGFNANLYYNNKKVATVDDDAWGGGFQYRWLSKEMEKQFQEFCNSMCEPWDYSDKDEFIIYGMDTAVDRLVSEYEFQRKLKQHIKNKVCFRVRGQDRHEYHYITGMFTKSIKEHIEKKYNVDVIFNEQAGQVAA